VFLAIWIVVFALIGCYLLGMFKMPHDSDLKFVSVFRMFLAIFFFSFVMYLIPGMFGAPVKIIAGFPPPSYYTEGWSIGSAHSGNDESGASEASAHCPNGLECFHDYKEGLAYAKELNKPVLLDFTGHACVNCRKMEEQVWTDPKIDKIIRNNYVLISLHVDDKRDLPEEDQFVNDKGEVIETIGGKWMELQISRYGTATQPYYRLVDFEGKDLTNEERSFDTDVNVYADFLNNGIKSFNTKHQ